MRIALKGLENSTSGVTKSDGPGPDSPDPTNATTQATMSRFVPARRAVSKTNRALPSHYDDPVLALSLRHAQTNRAASSLCASIATIHSESSRTAPHPQRLADTSLSTSTATSPSLSKPHEPALCDEPIRFALLRIISHLCDTPLPNSPLRLAQPCLVPSQCDIPDPARSFRLAATSPVRAGHFLSSRSDMPAHVWPTHPIPSRRDAP